ncbi:transposase [Amaricoccus sp.]|uniref:transposase n=1 Tax=Amaricoccus sp. TaxID=1872485 RepID=UPI0039E23F9D
MHPVSRRRFVATTGSDHDQPVFPDRTRGLAPTCGPNRPWVSGLTHVAVTAGFVCVAPIMDAWSRRIVGYAIGRGIDARLALAALGAAIGARHPPPGCIHHSDRGSQYAALACRERLAAAGLVGSMGRRGNPYDNAMAESLMKTLKVEGVYPMAFETFIAAQPSSRRRTPGRRSKPQPENPSAPSGPLQHPANLDPRLPAALRRQGVVRRQRCRSERSESVDG